MQGIFITIEGPDGAGKTTQRELLKEYLENKGYDVLITRDSGMWFYYCALCYY